MAIVIGKKQATRNVHTATGAGENTVPALSGFNFLSYVEDDAVVNSNIRQIQDAVFEHYPRVDSKDGETNDKIEEYNRQLRKTNFGRHVKEQFPALFYNGNMFFEIYVVGNKLKGIYAIDPETIKTTESDTGEIIKYTQTGVGNADIDFDPQKIIHIKAPSLRTGANGKPLMTPLRYPLVRKKEAENYLAGMIANLNPLLYMELVQDDDQQIKAIQNELRSQRKPLDPLKIITLLKDEKITRVDTGTTENFNSIFNYIEKQNDEIIRILQIPPIVAGTIDASNRSNSEIQERAVFGRTIDAWQNYFCEELRLQFEEKVGWKDFKFEFPIMDDRKQEFALVRANKFKELGYEIEAIHKTLVESGVKIEPKFIEVEVTKDIDDMPSRQPRPKEGIPQREEDRLKDVNNKTKKVAQ